MSENIQILEDCPPIRKDKKRKKRKWTILILIFIALISGVFLTLYQCGVFEVPSFIFIGAGVKEGTPSTSTGGKPEQGTNGTGQLSIELNAYPTFADGKSAGNLNIINPATNTLYMEVEIRIKDTGEAVYQSGVIPPNHYIDNDKLTKVLKMGEYKATASVTVFDPNNPNQHFNRANFDLVLIILN